MIFLWIKKPKREFNNIFMNKKTKEEFNTISMNETTEEGVYSSHFLTFETPRMFTMPILKV